MLRLDKKYKTARILIHAEKIKDISSLTTYIMYNTDVNSP